MATTSLVTAMSNLPNGRRWMISPEDNRVFVAAELEFDEQWDAVAEAVAELRAAKHPAVA